MKVILLDRDGVINEYPGDYKYVVSWKEFRFLPGVKQALTRLTAAGCRLFVISNQQGVSKGIFTQRSLDDITARMLHELKSTGAEISRVYYCTHAEEDNCSCRKPKTGLIDLALDGLKSQRHAVEGPLDCFFIGDTMRDIQTGKAAGCKTILVFSGKEKPENRDNWTFQPDFTAADLSKAADLILNL